MNHLKDYHIKKGINHFLTFADENAGIGLLPCTSEFGHFIC